MTERSDEELVADIQEGDIFAFEHLVRRYQRRLHAFAIHMTGDDAAAADVVQESFISLYKTIDRVDPKRKFSSYVFAIAKNTAISHLRSKKKEVSLEDIVLAGEDESLLTDLVASEQKHTIGQALGKLNEKYRRVVRLYYFDDLSYEEISKKMRVPMGTVRTHLRRAKAVLHKLLLYEKY